MRYLIGILIVVLLMVAACTPQQAEQEQQPNQEQQQQAPEQEQQQEQQQEAPKAGNSELASFFSKKAKLEYMVEYEGVTDTQGQTFESQMTMWLKGVDRIRTDTETQGVEARSIVDGNKIYTCTTATGSWMCFETEYDASAAQEAQAKVEENPAQYDVESIQGWEIAGVMTKCFRITVDSATVDYCFSPEGVPLYIKTEGSSFMNELTATSYSTTVSESAFELPAEPGAMPGMGDFEIPDY